MRERSWRGGTRRGEGGEGESLDEEKENRRGIRTNLLNRGILPVPVEREGVKLAYEV